MDALPARDLVRFVGLTIACRRIERVDAKAPKYHELVRVPDIPITSSVSGNQLRVCGRDCARAYPHT